MRYLFCGDRNWDDYDAILKVMIDIGVQPEDVIIHGGAKGADTLAGKAAHHLGTRLLVFEADWANHHRAAGPIRNKRMIVEGKPDAVFAFHNDLQNSKGTLNMIMLARRAKVPVHVRSSN